MRAFRLRLRRPGPLLPPLRLRFLPSPPLVSKPLHYNVVQVLGSPTWRPLELVHVGRTRDHSGPERQRPAPCCRWVCSNTGCGRGAARASTCSFVLRKFVRPGHGAPKECGGQRRGPAGRKAAVSNQDGQSAMVMATSNVATFRKGMFPLRL